MDGAIQSVLAEQKKKMIVALGESQFCAGSVLNLACSESLDFEIVSGLFRLSVHILHEQANGQGGPVHRDLATVQELWWCHLLAG